MKAKVAYSLIVGLILAGTIYLGTLAGIGRSSDAMSMLFLGFFALIIALQAVPAVLLFRYLMREICRRGPTEKEEAGAPETK